MIVLPGFFCSEVTIHFPTLMGAGLAAALMVTAGPLSAQDDGSREDVWRLGGLRNGFCVLFLLDPATASKGLPPGFKLVSAGEAMDLHPALKTEVEAQPELKAWSPSHLCFYAVDTIQTHDYLLRDKSGKKTEVLGLWTVNAADPSGAKRDVALLLLATNQRLIRSAHLAGQTMHEVEAKFGKAPELDLDGRPSGDNRFQVKVGKTLLTWDGRQSDDSASASGSVAINWIASATAGGKAAGRLTLEPQWAWPMIGALKVAGKDGLAKALQGSPARFVGPLYRGGAGEIRLAR